MKKRNIPSVFFFVGLTLTLVLSYWSVRPLLTEGFFPMHDDTQVGRVVAMGRALRNGQFPVRWVADLGYGWGYPIFNFYGPLPYYLGGMLYSLGMSGILATKVMFIVGSLVGGVAMYAGMYTIAGMAPAVAAATLFTYAPYRAVDMYIRGAVGEMWALSFLPLIGMGAFLALRKREEPRGMIITAVGIAGVILSHTLLGFVTTLFTGLAVAALGIRSMRHGRTAFGAVVRLGAGVGIAVLMTAFFWLPAVVEMGYTSVAGQVSSTADFHDHFVCISQLWNSPWGFAGTAPGCIDGMSFRLGKIHILASLIGIGMVLVTRRRSDRTPHEVAIRNATYISMTLLCVSVFFMTPLSTVVWELLPGFSYLQYPWRFLTFAVVGLSIAGSAWIGLMKPIAARVTAAGLLVAGSIFVYAKLFVPQYIYTKDAAAFETEEELQWRVSRISDEYLPPGINTPDAPRDVVSDPLFVPPLRPAEIEVNTETYKKFIFHPNEPVRVRIAHTHFPGWQYMVNGDIVSPEIDDGFPVFTVSEDKSVVELRLVGTPLRRLGNIVSIVTIAALFIRYGKKADA